MQSSLHKSARTTSVVLAKIAASNVQLTENRRISKSLGLDRFPLQLGESADSLPAEPPEFGIVAGYCAVSLSQDYYFDSCSRALDARQRPQTLNTLVLTLKTKPWLLAAARALLRGQSALTGESLPRPKEY